MTPLPLLLPSPCPEEVLLIYCPEAQSSWKWEAPLLLQVGEKPAHKFLLWGNIWLFLPRHYQFLFEEKFGYNIYVGTANIYTYNICNIYVLQILSKCSSSKIALFIGHYFQTMRPLVWKLNCNSFVPKYLYIYIWEAYQPCADNKRNRRKTLAPTVLVAGSCFYTFLVYIYIYINIVMQDCCAYWALSQDWYASCSFLRSFWHLRHLLLFLTHSCIIIIYIISAYVPISYSVYTQETTFSFP